MCSCTRVFICVCALREFECVCNVCCVFYPCCSLCVCVCAQSLRGERARLYANVRRIRKEGKEEEAEYLRRNLTTELSFKEAEAVKMKSAQLRCARVECVHCACMGVCVSVCVCVCVCVCPQGACGA